MQNNFNAFLASPLKSFKFPQPTVHCLNSEDTLKQASEVLSGNQVSSAPVFENKTMRFLGVVDFSDIVSFILESLYQITGKTNCSSKERLESVKDLTLSSIKASTLAHRFTSQHVKDFMNHSLRNPYTAVTEDTSLGEVLRHFAKGTQRVVVFKTNDGSVLKSDKDRLLYYLTQSTVLKFLASQVDLFRSLAEQQLGTINFGKKSVVEVKDGQLAITAFALMHEHRISGLPILNDQGMYVATISVKDIKHALSEFSHLTLTVREYIAYSRMESLLEISPTVFCKNTDTLGLVIAKLIKLPIHRLFIVDDLTHFVPIGVISYMDVLSFLVQSYLKE